MKKRNLLKAQVLLNVPILITLGVIVYFNIRQNQFSLLNSLIIPFSGLLFINVVFSFLLVRLRLSVNSISLLLENINQGKIEGEAGFKANNFFSVQELQEKFKELMQELKTTIQSIKRISSDDAALKMEELAKDSLIGTELFNLQEKLRTDKEQLEKSKKEEGQRNWAATGIAEFGDILRRDSSNMQSMGYSVVSKLVDYIDANQGALYVLNDDGDEPVYEIVASVAYGRKKLLDNKILVGEGLVGQCAFERKTIYMIDIPDGYINITSGLGEATPSTLLIIPCKIEDRVLAIIEIASFEEIEEYQIQFIEKLGESIASSISTLRNNEKTNALLEASKNQSEELAAQEEELRQNLEEMEATQEDLKRQMKVNAKMQEELKFEKVLFDTLLNNIPARINFKDKNRKYIRASKSFLERFGKKNNDEIVGKTDIDFFGAEFAAKTMADELEIMESGVARINFIEHEVKDDGSEIWKNVSKIPLYDENKQCIGIFASVYDITESKLLEKELAAEKQLFDTMLNNIPARINFKDGERKYIRASKSFLQRFGQESNADILGKTDFDFFDSEFAKKTMADELEIIESGEGRINFVEHEVKDDGTEIWKNVSKIPFFDDDNNCVGIFASVYDITDYKKIEKENKQLKAQIKKLKGK